MSRHLSYSWGIEACHRGGMHGFNIIPDSPGGSQSLHVCFDGRSHSDRRSRARYKLVRPSELAQGNCKFSTSSPAQCPCCCKSVGKWGAASPDRWASCQHQPQGHFSPNLAFFRGARTRVPSLMPGAMSSFLSPRHSLNSSTMDSTT